MCSRRRVWQVSSPTSSTVRSRIRAQPFRHVNRFSSSCCKPLSACRNALGSARASAPISTDASARFRTLVRILPTIGSNLLIFMSFRSPEEEHRHSVGPGQRGDFAVHQTGDQCQKQQTVPRSQTATAAEPRAFAESTELPSGSKHHRRIARHRRLAGSPTVSAGPGGIFRHRGRPLSTGASLSFRNGISEEM